MILQHSGLEHLDFLVDHKGNDSGQHDDAGTKRDVSGYDDAVPDLPLHVGHLICLLLTLLVLLLVREPGSLCLEVCRQEMIWRIHLGYMSPVFGARELLRIPSAILVATAHEEGST